MIEESEQHSKNEEEYETIFNNLYKPYYIFGDNEEDEQHQCAEILSDITRIGWYKRVQYAKREYQLARQRDLAKQEEIYRDPNHLLEVCISTIIILATGAVDIPTEYFMYTELYLRSITDAYGQRPPNISNLIQHIKKLKVVNNINWDDTYQKQKVKCVKTSMKRRSKIPVLSFLSSPWSTPTSSILSSHFSQHSVKSNKNILSDMETVLENGLNDKQDVQNDAENVPDENKNVPSDNRTDQTQKKHIFPDKLKINRDTLHIKRPKNTTDSDKKSTRSDKKSTRSDKPRTEQTQKKHVFPDKLKVNRDTFHIKRHNIDSDKKSTKSDKKSTRDKRDK